MGTWHIGDDPAMRVEELATLRLGLDLGALHHPLTPAQLCELDALFPPSSGPHPLQML
jgi:hypothetical protein